MNGSTQVKVFATDVTGQRDAHLAVPVAMVMGAVTAQAVELMALPTTNASTQQPIVYHTFEDGAGELIFPEQTVADIIQRYHLDVELRVRVVPELEAARQP